MKLSQDSLVSYESFKSISLRLRINDGYIEEKYEYESFIKQFILKEVNVVK